MSSQELRRVIAGVGWAVHALVFEFADGSRVGRLLHNNGLEMDLGDESISTRCWVRWQDVQKGDYIVRVSGNGTVNPTYLCHSITLDFASGREITFRSTHTPWRSGDMFSFHVPQPGLLRKVRFQWGQCTGIDHIETTAHLPIMKNAANLRQLPAHVKEQLQFILWVVREIDAERIKDGMRPVGSDIWWRALGFLTGFDILPVNHRSTLSKNEVGKVLCRMNEGSNEDGEGSRDHSNDGNNGSKGI